MGAADIAMLEIIEGKMGWELVEDGLKEDSLSTELSHKKRKKS